MALDNPTADIKTAFPGKEYSTGDTVTVGSDKYTYNDKGEFEASGDSADGVSKSTTPPTWDGPADAREHAGAGKYPNFYAHKTRSGHVLLMDDSKGAEHVTLQHRGGSMVQFHPDGKVAITAQNGQYTLTFGENRVKITGAYDVTVAGAASLKIDGDYNVTVGKDMNMTVQGDINMTGKNINQVARGNIDIAAKNITSKAQGSYAVQADGAMQLVSQGSAKVASSTDSLALCGKTMVSVLADVGQIMVRSGTKLSLQSMLGDVAVQTTTGKFSVFANEGILSFITSASLEALVAVQVISAGITTVKSTGMVGILAGAEVSIGAVGEVAVVAAGGVSIAAAGAVGVAAGGALALTAGGAVGINSSLIAMNGIIEQNSGIIIEAPVVDIPPVPPIPVPPVLADKPKLMHIALPSTVPTLEAGIGAATSALA